MNIHEYQARDLFEQFGVPTQRGKTISIPEQGSVVGEEILRSNGKLATQFVIKSQIYAGGRGKGYFKNGLKGGIQFCDTPSEIEILARKMLGQTLVTAQTGDVGKVVNKLFIAESVEILREFYFSIVLDRKMASPILIVSSEGGTDIEAVAEKYPEKIFRFVIHPYFGIRSYHLSAISKSLGLDSSFKDQIRKIVLSLYQLFMTCDCSMLEVNPLALTKQKQLLAMDAKFSFDDNALYRQPDIVKLNDFNEKDPREVEAQIHHLNYIGLDGDIGCLVNGAGLAMATMDLIQKAGGKPANFLDVGGSATTEQVGEAFRIIMKDKSVLGVFVNIFGGIMDCNIIADGIITAIREKIILPHGIPIVIRLQGNNSLVAEKKLEEYADQFNLHLSDSLLDAAKKIIDLVKNKN